MSVQRISPQSAKQWYSFSLILKPLTQKKAAQSKLFLDRNVLERTNIFIEHFAII